MDSTIAVPPSREPIDNPSKVTTVNSATFKIFTYNIRFSFTPLDLILREWKIDTLHLTGVCTDICVLHTAMDAYNRCYNLVVHENGVASFDQTGHKWALNHFKTCLGAEIVK